MSEKGSWSGAAVLHKNVYQYFYAEMDEEDTFHLMFQTGSGNIHYSRLDGQSFKTVPVLNSRTPSLYDKKLYIAPLKNNIYLFYVLQHESSYILAYQALGNSGPGNPKVVDYVSGSSRPCSIIYDHEQNIYVFYQTYDGKYLQLGYKKFNTSQKHWSEFSAVTRYSGNCEYPHAIVDNTGIIHLCYQRQTPKLFEMVYQQKCPDRNLWSREIIVHSSVHSFENASILQAGNKIIVYWIRDDIIYHNSGSPDGSGWNRASRYITQFGRQLQCLSYKSNHPSDRQRNPGIYPGVLTNGLKLAFYLGDVTQPHPQNTTPTPASETGGGCYSTDALLRLRKIADEMMESWDQSRKEMNRLTNAYTDLKKEIDKCSIRLSLIEKELGQRNLSGSSGTPATETNTSPSQAVCEQVEPTIPSESVKSSLDPEKVKQWEEWNEL